jgi:hypothetical protein
MSNSILPNLSKRGMAINLCAGLVITAGLVSFVRTTFARPYFEVCSSRYNRQLNMRLDREGAALTPSDVQALANGQDEGVTENLSIAAFAAGPVPYAMGIKLAQGTVEQRSTRGASGGISFPWLPSSIEEPVAACLSYNFFLPQDFAFDHGGTLPGFIGANVNNAFGSGPGFTTQLAWHAGGAPKYYMRVKKDSEEFSATLKAYETTIPRGKWVRVDQEIVLNSVTQSDGIARLWIDGRLEVETKNLPLRSVAEVTIAGVAGEVYFGGSDTGGKATQDATIWMSPFEIRWK